RRRAFARQGFLTQSAAKFAEKTCAYACEDGFLIIIELVIPTIPYFGIKSQSEIDDDVSAY
ncbi:MAG: hypothetical protein KH324_10990, partial [Ruminococcus sp.]|nr:hypothetical protein [Ruminococcus sp.]